MYVRGKRVQKGSTHSSSALQQRRTDGRRHTRETTETGACDYTGRSWKGRSNEKGGKDVAYSFFFSLLGQPGGVEEGGRTACGREISSWVGYPGGNSSGCLTS